MIDNKLLQVRSLRELATKATATLSDAPSGGHNPHRMEDIIAKIIDLEAEINADIDRLVDLKRDIVSAVKGVEDEDLQALLELRYLCFLTWSEVAATMRYGKDYVFELHRKALTAIKFATPQ
ncbi:MAG: DUF1492 domain-containing protein [Oscillospiraceae bacterium]|nr:DUF1492 domain-containing protein [Oscillospiraceae bacterium]